MSGTELIRDYFGNVTLEELKALGKESRKELADRIAAERGLVEKLTEKGTSDYVPLPSRS